MLQIIGYVLMGIGAISLIYFGYKLIGSFGMALEAGYRDQFPLGYLASLSQYVTFFEQHGLTKGDMIDLGSDRPGMKMTMGEDEVEIRMNSPLDDAKPSEIEINFLKQSIKVCLCPRKVMTDEEAGLLSNVLAVLGYTS